MFIWFWGTFSQNYRRFYGSLTVSDHQTWSNNQSQHGLLYELYGGVSLSISLNLKLAPVPYATPKAGKFASTNRKHYPDLGSVAPLVWNFCARSSYKPLSDVIFGVGGKSSGGFANCGCFPRLVFYPVKNRSVLSWLCDKLLKSSTSSSLIL